MQPMRIKILAIVAISLFSSHATIMDEDFNFEFCKKMSDKYYCLISKVDSITCDVEYSSFNDIKTNIEQNSGKSKYLKAIENVSYTLAIYGDGTHRFGYKNFQPTGDIAFDQMLLSNA